MTSLEYDIYCDILKQQLICYNICNKCRRCALLTVWRCLHIVFFCLSVTFFPFSFLDTRKPKCFHTSNLTVRSHGSTHSFSAEAGEKWLQTAGQHRTTWCKGQERQFEAEQSSALCKLAEAGHNRRPPSLKTATDEVPGSQFRCIISVRLTACLPAEELASNPKQSWCLWLCLKDSPTWQQPAVSSQQPQWPLLSLVTLFGLSSQ